MTAATLPTEKLMTGEELATLGNLGPCELVEGRIVEMSPTQLTHGKFEVRLSVALERVVVEQNLGLVVAGEVGIYTRRRPDTIRAADVIFISNERLARLQNKEGFLDVAPELVVEILSPNDYWAEVNRKLREYFTAGVSLVWVIDPDARLVYVYRSTTDVRELSSTDTLTGDEVLPGFSLSLAKFFE